LASAPHSPVAIVAIAAIDPQGAESHHQVEAVYKVIILNIDHIAKKNKSLTT
jgi:imidazoleglycerol phosphate dehydratase HisB